jgi:hypothetical protein
LKKSLPQRLDDGEALIKIIHNFEIEKKNKNKNKKHSNG